MISKAVPLFILVLMVLPSIPQTPSIQQATDLEWGVEVGDEITYVLQRKVLDEQIGQMFGEFIPFITEIDEGQKIVARVDYLPPIEENNTYGMFSGANCSIYRENDSELIMENMTMLVLPLGSWNVEPVEFNETATATGPGFGSFEVYNTTDEWGTVISGDVWFAIFHIVFNMRILYFKANGTLSRMEMKMDFSGTTSVDILFVQWRPNMATIIPGDFPILPVIIYSSIGIIVVLIIVYLWRRRKRKAIVNE